MKKFLIVSALCLGMIMPAAAQQTTKQQSIDNMSLIFAAVHACEFNVPRKTIDAVIRDALNHGMTYDEAEQAAGEQVLMALLVAGEAGMSIETFCGFILSEVINSGLVQ